jgi:DNA-binding IscR family transcriptional regulator
VSRLRVSLGYALSLPERTLRAAAAGLGGLLYEAAQVLLPGWLRRTRLYRAIVAGTLRIAIELVGGAGGVLPADEVTAQELAKRKAAGTGIEMAGLMFVGWSPLWLFAATADLTGGSRTYLRALVSELRRDGLLPEDVEFASVKELLDTLEGTSGLVAESLDAPPLNVDAMRASWQELRQHTTELPDAHRLADLYAELRQVAEREGHSLRSVSSLLAAGALRAGVKTGQVHIFDYYQGALRTIAREGLAVYARRVTRPYLVVAKGHFDPNTITYTERLLPRLRRGESAAGADRK